MMRVNRLSAYAVVLVPQMGYAESNIGKLLRCESNTRCRHTSCTIALAYTLKRNKNLCTRGKDTRGIFQHHVVNTVLSHGSLQ